MENEKLVSSVPEEYDLEDALGRLVRKQTDAIVKLQGEKKELVEALKDQHSLVDSLWAYLISLDPKFRPSKTPGFATMLKSADLLKKFEAI